MCSEMLVVQLRIILYLFEVEVHPTNQPSVVKLI